MLIFINFRRVPQVLYGREDNIVIRAMSEIQRSVPSRYLP